VTWAVRSSHISVGAPRSRQVTEVRVCRPLRLQTLHPSGFTFGFPLPGFLPACQTRWACSLFPLRIISVCGSNTLTIFPGDFCLRRKSASESGLPTCPTRPPHMVLVIRQTLQRSAAPARGACFHSPPCTPLRLISLLSGQAESSRYCRFSPLFLRAVPTRRVDKAIARTRFRMLAHAIPAAPCYFRPPDFDSISSSLRQPARVPSPNKLLSVG